jgi:hypothetical protein
LVVFMDESYSPAVLSRIAKEKRKTTGEDGWWSELDLVSITPKNILVQYILRPVKMLLVEPSEEPLSFPTRDGTKCSSATCRIDLHVFRLRTAVHAHVGDPYHLRGNERHDTVPSHSAAFISVHRYLIRRDPDFPRHGPLCADAKKERGGQSARAEIRPNGSWRIATS